MISCASKTIITGHSAPARTRSCLPVPPDAVFEQKKSSLAGLRRFSPRPLSGRRSIGTAFSGRKEPEVSQNNRPERPELRRPRTSSLPKRGSHATLNGALLSVSFFKECWPINIFLTMPPPLTSETRTRIHPKLGDSRGCCGFVRKTRVLLFDAGAEGRGPKTVLTRQIGVGIASLV